jgi:hypothetical protein
MLGVSAIEKPTNIVIHTYMITYIQTDLFLQEIMFCVSRFERPAVLHEGLRGHVANGLDVLHLGDVGSLHRLACHA